MKWLALLVTTYALVALSWWLDVTRCAACRRALSPLRVGPLCEPCALALAQDAVAIRRADRGTRASLAGVFHAAGLPGLAELCRGD